MYMQNHFNIYVQTKNVGNKIIPYSLSSTENISVSCLWLQLTCDLSFSPPTIFLPIYSNNMCVWQVNGYMYKSRTEKEKKKCWLKRRTERNKKSKYWVVNPCPFKNKSRRFTLLYRYWHFLFWCFFLSFLPLSSIYFQPFK